jgi:hypothetical protein
VPASFQVSYTWDGSNFLDRAIASTGVSEHAATNVTAFSWYIDTDATVVVSLTVTVQSYSESQTFRFDPRLETGIASHIWTLKEVVRHMGT